MKLLPVFGWLVGASGRGARRSGFGGRVWWRLGKSGRGAACSRAFREREGLVWSCIGRGFKN